MAYRAEGIVTIMIEIFKNSMPRRIPLSEEKETIRFSQFAANISHEENIPKRQILIIWTNKNSSYLRLSTYYCHHTVIVFFNSQWRKQKVSPSI